MCVYVCVCVCVCVCNFHFKGFTDILIILIFFVPDNHIINTMYGLNHVYVCLSRSIKMLMTQWQSIHIICKLVYVGSVSS